MFFLITTTLLLVTGIVMFGSVEMQVKILAFLGNFIREVIVAASAFWLVLWFYSWEKN